MPTETMEATPSKMRWLQLALGLIVMMAISSPQYVWTLFVKPFQGATGVSLPALQITFSVLIVLQTWLSPAQGWLVERFGPKLLVAAGAALTGLGWVLSAQATSLTMLYFTYGVLCGVGTGIVYIGIVGLMARWFPDRRGFAIGMVAAGYGMGALLMRDMHYIFSQPQLSFDSAGRPRPPTTVTAAEPCLPLLGRCVQVYMPVDDILIFSRT